jgi:alpha-beta hydrolase superfamily lysophospholipase
MIHEYKSITTNDGYKLNTLIKENSCPVWLVMTHGVGEHLERHQYLIPMLSQYYNICLYDLRGHGKSSGKRGHVDHFDSFYSDLQSVIDYLKKNYKMQRYVLMGHSMGALITAGYIQDHAPENHYPEKIFLSAPPASVGGVMGVVFDQGPFVLVDSLAALPFSVPLKGLVDLKKLSHDGRVYQAYVTDQLNLLSLHSRLLLQLVKHAKYVFSRPLRAKSPLYCVWGSQDVVISPEALTKYFTEVEKGAQTLVVDGGYHELHNEIEKYQKPFLDFLKDAMLSSIFNNYSV